VDASSDDARLRRPRDETRVLGSRENERRRREPFGQERRDQPGGRPVGRGQAGEDGVLLEAVHGPRVTGRPGYRAALVETSVAINACVSAYALRLELESRRCRVLFGTYDLASRYVRLAITPDARKTPSGIGRFPAPADDREARRIATAVAGSASVAALLRTGSDARGR